jgi:hypothetical protein
MSDDPEFSRRDFLRGLGAAAAAAVQNPTIDALGKTLDAATATQRPLHFLAEEFAEKEFSDGIFGLPVKGRQKAIRNLLDDAKLYEDFGGPSYQGMARAYRDAAKLLEAGWTPLRKVPWRSEIEAETAVELESSKGGTPPENPQEPTKNNDRGLNEWEASVEREAERVPLEVQPPPEMPREAIRTVTLAEHVDELHAELRGSLDSRERDAIAAELDAARTALKEQEHVIGSAPRPDITPNQRGADDVKTRLDDIDTAAARLSAETGLPYTPAVGGEFVTGIYRQSLALATGRFAMIDDGLGFSLVPWTPALDDRLAATSPV